MDNKQRILSGVKPTGQAHIGNYFGAMRQFVEMQTEYSSFIMIADYHALTLINDKEEMSENILNIAMDYLSIGLDPQKTIIFKQSDVLAHTELAWIFNTIITTPYLMRAHAFKDAQAKNREINVGTFDYPVLMAADILLYDTDVVPVGQDQEQHLEYTRNIAEKFNRIFGDTFKLPSTHVLEKVAVVPGTDGRKMSKSYKNTIPIFATKYEIEKLVMNIVIDSKLKLLQNIYNIHKLFRDEIELTDLYTKYSGKSKFLKETLVEDIDNFFASMRKKRTELIKNKDYVLDILKDGGNRANEIANSKIKIVRKKVGIEA